MGTDSYFTVFTRSGQKEILISLCLALSDIDNVKLGYRNM